MLLEKALDTLKTFQAMPETETFNGRPCRRGSIKIGLPFTGSKLADAYAVVESRDLTVLAVVAHPDDLDVKTSFSDFAEEIKDEWNIWGADVFLTREVPSGLIYLMGGDRKTREVSVLQPFTLCYGAPEIFSSGTPNPELDLAPVAPEFYTEEANLPVCPHCGQVIPITG